MTDKEVDAAIAVHVRVREWLHANSCHDVTVRVMLDVHTRDLVIFLDPSRGDWSVEFGPRGCNICQDPYHEVEEMIPNWQVDWRLALSRA